MVKFPNTNQNNLPTVANNFFPNPTWCATNSTDYKQLYEKKTAFRHFQQARSVIQSPEANLKVGAEYKLDVTPPTDTFTDSPPTPAAPTPYQFYNFANFHARSIVSKYHHLINPYCNLTNDVGATAATGQQIYNNTLNSTAAGEGIAGRNNSETPNFSGVAGQVAQPRVLNRIKGGIRFDGCYDFKNGFKPNQTYYFRP